MVTPAEDGEPRDRVLGRAFGLSRASKTNALNKDGDEGEKGREEEEDKEQVEERTAVVGKGRVQRLVRNGGASPVFFDADQGTHEASISSLLRTTSSPTYSVAASRGEMLVWVDPSCIGGGGESRICLTMSCSSFQVLMSERYDARETKVEGILMSSVFSASGNGISRCELRRVRSR